MGDHTSWSLPLGRWGGVKVRLHMVLLLFSACTLYFGWRYEEAGSTTIGLWMAAESLVVVIFSVVVHELGHAWATQRVGGKTSAVTLGPLGGIDAERSVPSQRGELLVYLAGPAANLAVCLICLPLFMLYSEPVLGLIPPLMPYGLTGDWSSVAFSRLLFWVNWVFLFVNLMPLYPFDGNRAFQLAILLRWPRLGYPGASLIVSCFAKILAAGIFAAALMVEFDELIGSPAPTRFALILLAILMFFCSRQQDATATDTTDSTQSKQELEPSQEELVTTLEELEKDLAGLDEPLEGPLGEWLESRREARQERELQQLDAEEQALDDLLRLIHRQGVDSLSDEQRDLLQRVSARLRDRSES